MRHNRRQLPEEILRKQNLFATAVLKTEENTTLAFYQCKISRAVLLLSSHNDDVAIPHEENPKRKPDITQFYNKNKVAVDVVNQML